jgi:hypothetical protein
VSVGRLRGRRMHLDEGAAGTLWVCERCNIAQGPYATLAAARFLAAQHWDAWHRGKPRDTGCTMPHCPGEHHGLGYCNKHYRRLHRRGDPNVTFRPGRKRKPRASGTERSAA